MALKPGNNMKIDLNEAAKTIKINKRRPAL
jgi:hypothetical protein